MKSKTQKTLTILVVLVLVGISLATAVTKAAGGGSATLSLSPASGSYTTGATISVGIYEDSGSDSIGGVQANLTYNASLLSCSAGSIQNSSAFNLSFQSTCGGGSAQIARTATTPVTGSQLVATINFTASAAGTATISFASGSDVVRSTDYGNETLTTVGGSYTITTPAPPPSPPPSGGSGSVKKTPSSSSSTPSSSPSSSPASSPATPTAPFTITDVKVINLSDKTATITWLTSVPATSEVDYGSTTHYVVTSVDNTLTTNHHVVLDPDNLKASSTYHFLVKSYNAAHQLVAGKDTAFKTVAALPQAKSSKAAEVIAIVLTAIVVLAAVIWVLIKKGLIMHHHPPDTHVGGNFIGGSGGNIITPSSGNIGTPTISSMETAPEEEPAAISTDLEA